MAAINQTTQNGAIVLPIPNRIRRSPLPAIRCSCVKIESPQSVEPVTRQNAAATGLLVKGMTCGNCARHVIEAIQSVSGVRSATVSLENKKATVRWNPGATINIRSEEHTSE